MIGQTIGRPIGRPVGHALSKGGVSPLTILGAALVEWWTADRPDLITLSGSAVTSWRGVKNGYNVVQGVGVARPLWSATSFNGSPGITFDGIDDQLTLASVPLPTGADPCEMWAVLQQSALPADTATRRWLGYGGTTNNDSRFPNRSVSVGVNRSSAGIGTGATFVAPPSPLIDFSGRFVHRVIVTGSLVRQALDDNAETADSAAIPATGTSLTRIGAATTGIGFWQGPIRDVIVTNAVLTTEQKTALLAWALPRRNL